MNFDLRQVDGPENRHTRSLLEQALGQLLLEHLDVNEQIVKELSAVHALKILEGILDAMDDDSLDDFHCIDRIVDILGEYGLHTCRHDW